jgi:hypothetical protein
MKKFTEYLAESSEWMITPAEGDDFAIELPDEVLCETYIIEVADDCILLDSTEEINAALTEWAALEDTDEGESGIVMEDEWSQLRKDAEDLAIKQMTTPKSAKPKPGFMQQVGDKQIGMIKGLVKGAVGGTSAVDEAEYQGRKVTLGKPMQGDVKKFKVYVKDPKTGNVKKVNFGDKTMRIKKSNPARRKSFRARHNCANPGSRTKARYWSCRKW